MKFIQVFSLIALASMPVSGFCKRLKVYMSPSDELSCASKIKIRDEHMHPGHCEKISKSFYSYRVNVRKNGGQLHSKDCQFFVYELPGCKGRSLEHSDLAADIGTCQNATFSDDSGRVSPGRSAKLMCRKKSRPIPLPIPVPISTSTSVVRPTSTGTTTVVLVTSVPSSTVEVPVVFETTTTHPLIVEDPKTSHVTTTVISTSTSTPPQPSTMLTTVTSPNIVKGSITTATHTETSLTVVPATPRSTQTHCSVLCSTNTIYPASV